MSKVRTVIVSVGIEAAVRPICGKGKARADSRKTFPLYFFIDHGLDGESVLPYVIHESRTRIIHSGTMVGHHFPRSQFTRKVSARWVTRWLFVYALPWNF
jgi:hypothetical protein